MASLQELFFIQLVKNMLKFLFERVPLDFTTTECFPDKIFNFYLFIFGKSREKWRTFLKLLLPLIIRLNVKYFKII